MMNVQKRSLHYWSAGFSDMNFFNLDLHISVIADISAIFHQLGHEVTSWTLSSHAWVFGRQRDRVEVVNEQSWFHLDEAMCDQFLHTYRAFLDQFDGFIVTHTPAFYLLYRKLGKPVIVVASTRYEYPFSFDRKRWQWFNDELRAGIDRGQVIAVANNRYDAAYAEYFSGRHWQVIPSYCGYTGASYRSRRKQFVYQAKYGGLPLPPAVVRKEQALPLRYQWQDLFDYRGIVHVPYNASTMSIFEQYTAGAPLFFPTPGYLMALYRADWRAGVLAEISYNQVHQVAPGSAIAGALPGFADPNDYRDVENISRWIALADYYDTTMMPGINYFDSARHLEEMLADVDIDECAHRMQEANEWRRRQIYTSWHEVLKGISNKAQGKSIDDLGGRTNMPTEHATSVVDTQPLVSAIVSTYNAERFMRACLEDLEAQTIADRLEVIVVDTGSPQNEGAIVREFQQRYDNIVYIRTARRQSLYAAWNRGIQAARGKYITNANTDDRHKHDAFERLVATLEGRPDIALVYANAHVTTTENETFANHTRVGELNWPYFDPLELLKRCCVGPQPMWRKRLHETYGYFDESFEVAGDWEFWLRIAENETFLHLREVLGLYLSSPTGVENRNAARLGQENLRVRQRYGHRTDQRTNHGAAAGAAVAEPANIQADQHSARAAQMQDGDQRLQPAAAAAGTVARSAVQRREPPAVSCICPTYGRVALLEEAIYSFLQQNYRGRKELIVLNDYNQQQLIFEHPEVRVINLPRRVRTVGEKRNMAVALAAHDLLFLWDDDDICLPHRLSFSVECCEPAKGFFKASSAWFWNDGQLSGPCRNDFHGISCWSRQLFDAVRGYGASGSGEDKVFEQYLKRQFPDSISASEIRPEEIYYIYRWLGTGSYHMSQFGDYQAGENIGHAQVESYVQQQAGRGEIRHGAIQLQPGWKCDYRQLVASHLATLAKQQAQGQE